MPNQSFGVRSAAITDSIRAKKIHPEGSFDKYLMFQLLALINRVTALAGKSPSFSIIR